jgi:hypothetical protein
MVRTPKESQCTTSRCSTSNRLFKSTSRSGAVLHRAAPFHFQITLPVELFRLVSRVRARAGALELLDTNAFALANWSCHRATAASESRNPRASKMWNVLMGEIYQ